MASGLARQLGFCSLDNDATTVDVNSPSSPPPSWCADDSFVQSLRDAQTHLWTSIQGAEDGTQISSFFTYENLSRSLSLVTAVIEVYSEVWSYSFDNSTNTFAVADIASLSPSGTESDAIQLWSYGFLAVLDPGGNSARP